LAQRHMTFMSIPDDQFNDKVKKRLGQVVEFVAELFHRKIADEHLIELWLDEKLIEQLMVEHATVLSLNLTEKIEPTDLKMQAKQKLIDEVIKKQIAKLQSALQRDIEELENNFSFL
jgi:hypothetical protein